MIFLLIVGCTTNTSKHDVITSGKIVDSTSYYMRKSKESTLSITERIRCLDRAAVFVAKGNESERGYKFSKIAFSYYKFGDTLQFKKFNEIAINEAFKVRDSFAIGDAYWSYADVFKQKENYDSAYVYFKKAYTYFNTNKTQKLAAKMLYKMALIQGYYKNVSISEQLTIKSIHIYENIEDFESLFACFNHLAILQNDIKEYDLALKYHKKAFTYLDDFEGGEKYVRINSNNIGKAYINKGALTTALSYFEPLVKTIKFKNNISEDEVRIIDNWAYCRFLLHDTIGLHSIFKHDLKIQDSLGHIPGRIISNLRLAKFESFKEDTIQAIKYALVAKRLAGKIKNGSNYLESVQLLAKLDTKQQSAYLTEYIRYKDSLDLIDRQHQNKFARIAYETDEYIKANEALSKEKLFIISISIVGIIILLLLFIIILQRSKNDKLILETERQKASEQIYQLTHAQHKLIEKERQEEQKRISEELHDGVLGKLFGVRMSVGFKNLDENVSTNDIEEMLNELTEIETEIRQMSHRLNSQTNLSDVSFEHLMRELIKNSGVLGNFDTTVEVTNHIEWESINKIVFINLYRILQESMYNIMKYASATKVVVRLTAEANHLKLQIQDNGVGFNVYKRSTGIGLKNMKSRVKKLHGHIQITSIINKGTSISCEIPHDN